MSEDTKHEGHEENEGEHVAQSSEPITESAEELGLPEPEGEGAKGDESPAADREDDGDNGRQHTQERPEVPVEKTLASVNRYDDPDTKVDHYPKDPRNVITEAKKILTPRASIVTPGSNIYQHLTEHDGIQRMIEMCMKYADVGIKYPVGPQFIRDNACIVDNKVMLYIVPLATVTEIEVWFVAKEQCLVRGVFTLELLDNETLAELEGEFTKYIAAYVQNRRLH